MIVLDTTVVSELMRQTPASAVVEWVRSCSPRELFTTAVTLAEVRYGIERLPKGRRTRVLTEIAERIFGRFEHQLLPFDARATAPYAVLVRERDRAGLPIDGFDAQIAAICRTHRAVLATRNDKDFQHTGIDVIDPWLG